MARQAPKIDERKFNDLLKLLKDLAPHYTPEWQAEDETDPGEVLLRVFSLLSEGVIARLNLAPHKNFVAFLDMLALIHSPVGLRRCSHAILGPPPPASGTTVSHGLTWSTRCWNAGRTCYQSSSRLCICPATLC